MWDGIGWWSDESGCGGDGQGAGDDYWSYRVIEIEDFFNFSFFGDHVQRADVVRGSNVVGVWGRFWSSVVWGTDR